jgi:PIN domain nuclease of toxin-antitoxin system
VTAKLLLDTHIAVWLDNGDDRLRGPTREMIDRHWQDGGLILLSAVTAWEIALLVDGGRISLSCPVDVWIAQFASSPGIELVPLSVRAATLAYRLHHLPHRDPADRLLIATAIEHNTDSHSLRRKAQKQAHLF